jgi:hypothetical protein
MAQKVVQFIIGQLLTDEGSAPAFWSGRATRSGRSAIAASS